MRQLTEKFDKVELDDICVAVQVCELAPQHSGCSVPCAVASRHMHNPRLLQVLQLMPAAPATKHP